MTRNHNFFGTTLVAMSLLLMATTAGAIEKGDWMVRGRFVNFSANDGSGPLTGTADATVRAESGRSFELDLTYNFTPHFSLELSATDVGHDMEGTGSLAGMGDVADFRMLPVTLTAQCRFLPSRFASPYIGAGVNYTNFHDVDPKVTLIEGASTMTQVDMDDSFGFAAQVGVDLFFSEHWSMNFDLKYLDIDSDVHFESEGATMQHTELDMNPWVSGVGVGFRF